MPVRRPPTGAFGLFHDVVASYPVTSWHSASLLSPSWDVGGQGHCWEQGWPQLGKALAWVPFEKFGWRDTNGAQSRQAGVMAAGHVMKNCGDFSTNQDPERPFLLSAVSEAAWAKQTVFGDLNLALAL